MPAELTAQEAAQWQWRLRCMGLMLPGASFEDITDVLKGIASYEGDMHGLCSILTCWDMTHVT